MFLCSYTVQFETVYTINLLKSAHVEACLAFFPSSDRDRGLQRAGSA